MGEASGKPPRPHRLHGEAYRGHVFWDELFVLPVLNVRLPEVSRSLLKYRYYRLPAARRAAADAGHVGAMYPWQSGSDGTEQSPARVSPGRANPDAGPDGQRAATLGARLAAQVRPVPRRWHHQPVRRLREAERAGLEGLPRPVRLDKEAGPHPGSRGRQPEPVQGLQAGGRADALLPAACLRARRAAAPADLRLVAGRIPDTIDYYLAAPPTAPR